ncbi:MAG: hypothetical protein BLITH_1315 [Brockia lithotrophica]|uniref:Exodeoxyribonuclease 7 small subunit n=1 Tax=Brockia lithotrophica TaxID=933949 RepID=A0A2T5G665_9BACL|nr:MAG: hypothetical protein BLITH_1315 [Brockia lithotrophica]
MDDASARAEKGTWTFEKALVRLEEVVERLESADLPLEEALSLYEEGTRLVRYLNRELNRFEQRVRFLREEDAASDPDAARGVPPVQEDVLSLREQEEGRGGGWEVEGWEEEEFVEEEVGDDAPDLRL